jgi:hypothetical protein
MSSSTDRTSGMPMDPSTCTARIARRSCPARTTPSQPASSSSTRRRISREGRLCRAFSRAGLARLPRSASSRYAAWRTPNCSLSSSVRRRRSRSSAAGSAAFRRSRRKASSAGWASASSRRQTPGTRGLWRATRAAKASSSRSRMKRPSNSASQAGSAAQADISAEGGETSEQGARPSRRPSGGGGNGFSPSLVLASRRPCGTAISARPGTGDAGGNSSRQ